MHDLVRLVRERREDREREHCESGCGTKMKLRNLAREFKKLGFSGGRMEKEGIKPASE